MTELKIRKEEPLPLRTGIARSLIAEIAEHLDIFARTGEEHAIDLKSLPMTDGDREEIAERLGVGEVRAELAVVGRSEVFETRYAGVWRVTHFGTGDAPAADEIVIARTPAILLTHPDDARVAAQRLRTEIRNEMESLDATNRESAAHV